MNKLFLLFVIFISTPIWGQQNKKYFIGDIYNENNITGIVVKVENDGSHGLIMSLDEIEAYWSCDPTKRFDKRFLFATSASDKNDGMKNMETISEIIRQQNLSWAWFPAFQWCKNKGEGWYLPAINELVEINKACHGGRIESNKAAKKAFNMILKKNGGESLKVGEYFSSTEFSNDKAYAIYFSSGVLGYGHETSKYKLYVRAVRRF